MLKTDACMFARFTRKMHAGRHMIALCNELQVENCEKVRVAGGEI